MNAMLYLLLTLSLILCCIAASQNAALVQTNPAVVITAPAPPPLPPPSPVDTFRKILAMSPPDREKFLAALPPAKRQIVMLKLDEYQGLPAEQREQRLRALQVQVHVRQLIKLAPSNRVERLATLQVAERPLVEARLAKWDQLPPEVQQEVLTNEIAIRHIARSPDFMFNPGLPPFPAEPKVAKELAHWSTLSDTKRTEILEQVENFMEQYTSTERARILAQRPDMKTSAALLANLAKEQSQRYIAGFRRYNALTRDERQKFLSNAARWQQMSPEQRDSWRILAKKLSSVSPPPPALPGRPSASLVPTTDHASLDLPSR